MWPFDDILAAVNAGLEALPGLVNLILYPLLRIQDLLYNLVMYVVDKFYILFNNLLAIPTMIYGLFESVFVAVLPLSIMLLISAMFLIVVALRVYSFIKDIEILGFKI